MSDPQFWPIKKLVADSNHTNSLISGTRGEYKLVNVNGTAQEVEGCFLQFFQSRNSEDNIPTHLYFGDKPLLWGYIVKKGKGDLYEFYEPKFVPKRMMGRTSMDSGTILTSIKNLKRIKFSYKDDKLDQLTIISTDPNTTLLFKRFVRERPPYVTSEVLA